MQKVDRRLWLDADGNLVEDGDPAAAILWHPAGDEITDEEAEAVGYRDGEQVPDDPDDDAELKLGDTPENKAVESPDADKAEKPAPAKRTRKAAKK